MAAMSDEPDAPHEKISAASLPAPLLACEPGVNLTRWERMRPYRTRRRDHPIYRPLRIYALDPAQSKLEGAVAIVNVPWEPLQPGPRGALFEVIAFDSVTQTSHASADLEDRIVLMRSGYDPSPTNMQFHQQMVYAVSTVVYSTFRRALGRDLSWGFLPRDANTDEAERLLLIPFGLDGANAFYDPTEGSIRFGYFSSDPAAVSGNNLPGGVTFTALSHDIIAHELSHALLDGLRSRFLLPSNRDVMAFHEGFADLVAIFQHFSYGAVVRTAIAKSGGNLEENTVLSSLADQFGRTTGLGQPLRTAIDFSNGVPRKLYADATEAHELGAVLVAAVFHAFSIVFKRKAARYMQLSNARAGAIGTLPGALHDLLANEASQLAGQFLSICIRAIDYCPPVDMTFGEFLRAVMTADSDLVPDDPWGYREAWIEAFRIRGIFPSDVKTLSEDALLWRAPDQQMPAIAELSFGGLRFDGDPAHPMSADDVRAQADALGRLIAQPQWLAQFGLAKGDETELCGDAIGAPVIESIRTSRRIGPDGQILFDLIAEVTQCRTAYTRDDVPFELFGGSTIIFGPDGDIRYIVSKSVLSETRLERQRDFMAAAGANLWMRVDGRLRPRQDLLLKLHAARTTASS